jgi:hypothetical protein
MRDVYEMATYLFVIIASCFVMGIYLKRKAKKRLNESNNSASEEGGDN